MSDVEGKLAAFKSPMIVPQYWAEGRVQHRKAGKQITVRRFGWSDTSQDDAQSNADERTQEALARMLSGEKLDRREPKIAYNGADGVPIREEILDRRGETIITRNSYGARCLNTPNVFFADIDFGPVSLPRIVSVLTYLMLGVGLAVVWFGPSRAMGTILIISALVIGGPIANWVQRAVRKSKGGEEKIAITRISDFITKHPEWSLRIYRTPAGLRVLATHSTFSPADPAVAECFKALGTDRMYSRMCLKQQCFRARVGPKPWRIGISDHLRPRPGVWPVNPERLPQRNEWLTRYEAAAKSFASCRLIESIGSGVIAPEILPVQEWHDELSGAVGVLPIA